MTFSAGEGAGDRALARSERLLDAARELANETGSAAFTVAQVAERGGASLKGFYACFSSKDDLLLALLEEDSRVGATLLAEHIDGHREPVDRLRAYLHGIFWMVDRPGALGYVRVLVREHRRLGEERPDDLRTALAPLVDLLARELEPVSPDPARDAETLFGMLLGGVHEVTLGRRDPYDEADHLWRLWWSGLAATTERVD